MVTSLNKSLFSRQASLGSSRIRLNLKVVWAGEVPGGRYGIYRQGYSNKSKFMLHFWPPIKYHLVGKSWTTSVLTLVVLRSSYSSLRRIGVLIKVLRLLRSGYLRDWCWQWHAYQDIYTRSYSRLVPRSLYRTRYNIIEIRGSQWKILTLTQGCLLQPLCQCHSQLSVFHWQ